MIDFKAEYEGHVPCKCCGIPIGKDSPAARNDQTCLGCLDFMLPKHNPKVCAQDFKAVVAFWQNPQPVTSVTLPSGRILTDSFAEPAEG